MNPANIQGVAPPQAPISLLHMMAEDADLRARFEADPVGAFAEHGIQIQGNQTLSTSAFDDITSSGDGAGGPIVKWAGLLG